MPFSLFSNSNTPTAVPTGCSSNGRNNRAPNIVRSTSNNCQAGGSRAVQVEEDPPPYESLVPQPVVVNETENGKPLINPIYKRKSVIVLVVCMCSMLILGIVGFSLNLSRTEDIKSEVNHIKHNHLPSLRQQTLDLDSRADQMERMIKQLLSEQESLREEIKRLRGEQENADELRKEEEEVPSLKFLQNKSPSLMSCTTSLVSVLVSSLISSFIFNYRLTEF